jgi:hypothetical protein
MKAPRLATVLAVLAATAGLTVQPLAGVPAEADKPQVAEKQDFKYPREVVSPTADKPQSKLWYAYGSWWGLLVERDGEESDGSNGATVRIFELDDASLDGWRDTGVVVDARLNSTADVLWDGDTLYVASRAPGADLRVSHYTYDAAEDEWSLAGAVETVGSGGPESGNIAKDSTGRLWITYTEGDRVWVAHTTVGDRQWGAAYAPAAPDTTITADDISSVVSFDDSIGVMWSDQESDRYTFAVHSDGDPDDVWSIETAISGFGIADDHLSLQVARSRDGDRVLAAIKTSFGDLRGVTPTAPQVMVLVRDNRGSWSSVPAGTVEDGHTRPILAIDSSNKEVYLISAAAGLGVFYKRASLDDLAFPGGRGEALMGSGSGAVNDPVTAKAAGTAESGLVVLASSDAAKAYHHATISLPTPEADTADPAPPATVTATVTTGCQVELLWPAAHDDVEVVRYSISRDDVPVGSTTSTSYVDTSATCHSTHRYSVTAEDRSGNTSSATSTRDVDIAGPPAAGTGIWLRGNTTASTDTGSILTIPMPETRPGDVLLVSVDAAGIPAVQPPQDWRLVVRDRVGNRIVKATYMKIADGREAAAYDWRIASDNGAVGTALSYVGVAVDQPIRTAVGRGEGPVTEITTPDVGVVSDGAAVVALFGVLGEVSIAPPPQMVGLMMQANGRLTAGAAELRGADGAIGSITATTSRVQFGIGQVLVLRADDVSGE